MEKISFVFQAQYSTRVMTRKKLLFNMLSTSSMQIEAFWYEPDWLLTLNVSQGETVSKLPKEVILQGNYVWKNDWMSLFQCVRCQCLVWLPSWVLLHLRLPVMCRVWPIRCMCLILKRGLIIRTILHRIPSMCIPILLFWARWDNFWLLYSSEELAELAELSTVSQTYENWDIYHN